MIHQAATSPGVLMVSSPRKRKERELEEAAQALDCEQAARAAESIAAGWSQAGERSPEVLRHRDERWPTFSAACRSVAMSVSTCVGWQVCSVGTPLRDGERLPVRRIACLRARRCIAVWVCWCAGSRISSSKLILAAVDAAQVVPVVAVRAGGNAGRSVGSPRAGDGRDGPGRARASEDAGRLERLRRGESSVIRCP